jgi:transcription elongation factor GreA
MAFRWFNAPSKRYSVEKVPITERGYAQLEDELKHLKHDERPAIIRAIAEAREHGDLSENAEYHAARERQSFVEGRILELEDLIARAEVIRPDTMGGDTIKFGATVTLTDDDTGVEAVYHLVGAPEADFSTRRIAITSPMGRAMIGKKKADTIEVKTPSGFKSYEVIKIVYE